TAGARHKHVRTVLRKVLQRWTRMKNPFRPQAPGRSKRSEPVQGELLLDTITVVRNDLNETDLELVAAAEPQPESAPAQPEIKAAESARLAWRRVTARLFGDRRSRRV